MATETFPTLSVTPGYPIEEQEDETGSMASKSDAGYVHGRRRYTKGRTTYKVNYPGMPSSDKATLKTFVKNVGIGIDFDWTNPDPDDGSTYECRFIQIPTFKKIAPNVWQCSFLLLTI